MSNSRKLKKLSPGEEFDAMVAQAIDFFTDGGRVEFRTPKYNHDGSCHACSHPPSPIEKLFWDVIIDLAPSELRGIQPEYEVGQYRLDFALPQHKIGIELDGHATHSSTTAIASDRKRQRDLELSGWYIIRFGGAEVYSDADGCVMQACKLIRNRIGK